MGWRHLNYTKKDELSAAMSDLVTVASIGADGQLEVFGTAFPIIASKPHSVLLTATHVIQHAFSRSKTANHPSNTSDMAHLPGPDNSLWMQIGRWAEESSDLKCLICVGQDLVECEVTGVCLRPPLDIALIVVDTTPLGDQPMLGFSINSDPLNVGDDIVVTSFVTEDNKPHYTRTLVGRYGQITGAGSPSPLVDAPVYTTNIPIEPGASGGPAYAYSGHFLGPKQVIGVISADASTQEAFDDEEVDGCSRISLICSAAPLQVSDKEAGLLNFQELCARQTIKDHGSAMKNLVLKYYPDGNWHQKVPVGRR